MNELSGVSVSMRGKRIAMMFAWMGLAGIPGAGYGAAPGDSAAIEEIVVTARKREELLQDIPISGVAFSGDDLREQQIIRFDDLVFQVPGADLLGNGPEFLRDVAIRGVGTGRQSDSNSATGIYKNGVFNAGGTFGGRSFTPFDLIDVERVEVFRGPQSALFGRNALGGAMNLVTGRPGHEFEASATLHWDDEQSERIEAMLNLPLLPEHTALRLAALWEDRDGHADNEFDGSDDYAAREYRGIRTSLRTDWSDRVDTTLVLEYQEQMTPGFSAALGKFPPLRPDPFSFNNNTPSETNSDELSATFDVNVELGAVLMTAIVNYKERDSDTLDDLDGFVTKQALVAAGQFDDGVSAVPPLGANAVQRRFGDFERWIAEVRLQGDLGPRSRWLLGVDWLDEDEQFRQVQTNAGPLTQTIDRDRQIESQSIFGSFEHSITEKLVASIELRGFAEDRQSVAVFSTPAVNQIRSGDADNFEWLPVIALSYQLRDDLMLFARSGRGARSGGFNDRSDSIFTYDDEFVLTHELGVKSEWLNGRLSVNGSIYYNDFDDTQATAPLVGEPGVIMQNLGSARSYGGELEAAARFDLGPGRMTLSAGLFGIDGEFTDSRIVTLTNAEGGSITDSLDGLELPNQRDLTVNLRSTYAMPIMAGGAMLVGSATWSYARGGVDGAQFNAPELDTRDQLDLRVAINTDRWSVAAFGRNVTDEDAVLDSVGQGNVLLQQPAVWGLSLTVRTN